jgi:Xaa-Pro aminopeptidase
LVDLLPRLPTTAFRRAVEIVGPLRERKDATEIAALAAAGAAADRVAAQLQGGELPLLGRTEAQVSTDLSQRLIAEGHDKVNFAIVAAGANAASPHHHAADRVIRAGEAVLLDFGGTMAGYCSDITRCVSIGEPAQEVADAYAVLHAAQAAGVAAGLVGVPCEEVDGAARRVIADAGYGEYFIHRTGHGIGREVHEPPYAVEGDPTVLEPGMTFSVEPGIYLDGRFGVRIEDIVAVTDDGVERLNRSSRELRVVE